MILKSGVSDDSLSISMYSQKIIEYINQQSTPIQVFCDGSFSFINHLQLLILGTQIADELPYTEFFPFAILITNRKTEIVYQRFFQELKDDEKMIWKNHLFTGMTDMELGISNTAQKVFPGSQWHLCWFHVSHNIFEKLTELNFSDKLKFLIFSEIKKIHQAKTLLDVKNLWKKLDQLLRTTDDPNYLHKFELFIEYCEKVYFPDDILIRWITKVDQNGNILNATNNSMERFNLHFKTIVFQNKKLKKIENAIKILHHHLQMTEQTLGLFPSISSIECPDPMPNNDLGSYLASTKGLASYINETMHSKLGGKKKKKQSNFMDPPHCIDDKSLQDDNSSSLSNNDECNHDINDDDNEDDDLLSPILEKDSDESLSEGSDFEITEIQQNETPKKIDSSLNHSHLKSTLSQKMLLQEEEQLPTPKDRRFAFTLGWTMPGGARTRIAGTHNRLR